MMLSAATAQTVSTLHNFDGTHGATPQYGALTQGRDGKLYGTTSAGGPYMFGVIFRLSTTPGQGTVLYDMKLHDDIGADPGLNPILASDGNYYGAAQLGGSYGYGYGAIYRITPSGVVSAVYDFTGGADGILPSAPMQGQDDNLWGVSYGIFQNTYNLFKVTRAGAYSTVFTSNQIASFAAPPYQDSAGYLYLAAYSGTDFQCGAIMKLTTAGVWLNSHIFDCYATDGANPFFPPIQAADGNFYGTTPNGGEWGVGVLYRIDGKTGDFTVLHQFNSFSGDGRLPYAGVIQGSDGNFYGVTYEGGANGAGSLYQYTPSGVYNQIYSFPVPASRYSSSQQPVATLLQHTNGKFYGTASFGSNSHGSIYVLDMGLAPFITFVRPQGHPGATAQILGQSLTGASSVTFSGVSATSFSVVSDTYLTAVVPTGATTGPVVVTTPSGALTSNVNFKITK
jgi:uncharacterized repeat protein (TIGR03803 family)